MKTCRQCKSNKIKSRTNYSHGKKSSSRTTFHCQNCGSTDIEIKTERRGRRR